MDQKGDGKVKGQAGGEPQGAVAKKPRKRRRFWQLHLSTAILLMFTAGAIVWPNVPLRFVAPGRHSDYTGGNIERGWPLAFQIGHGRFIEHREWVEPSLEHFETQGGTVEFLYGLSYNVFGILLDSLCALPLLLAVAATCEWHIRRGATVS
jgi:hypothetical protein